MTNCGLSLQEGHVVHLESSLSQFHRLTLQGASSYSYELLSCRVVQDNLEAPAKKAINSLMIETELFSYPIKNQHVCSLNHTDDYLVSNPQQNTAKQFPGS